MQPDRALALAIDAVRETGNRLAAWRAERRFDAKVVGQTIKAEADRMANDCLMECLGASGYPVLSEEEPEAFEAARPSVYWLIDPLDGTASFVGGYSGFVTQVAFMQNAWPIAAAVYAPALDLLYSAKAGHGAQLNGQPLSNTGAKDSIRLIDNYPEPRGFAAQVYAGLPCCAYVESGSIGLKICRVADGTADLFVKDVAVRDWDVAAPQLILTETGGNLTRLNTKPFAYVGNPEHHGIVAAGTRAVRDRFVQWHAAVQ